MLDAATMRELNGPAHDKQIDIVLANMERLRWLPRDLGKTYVMVNLPDFRLKVMSEGEQVWTTRVVIGKTAMPTPILFAQMKYITINPTWNVPQSIVQNEYLPALAQDPTVLQRMGLRVEHERDGTVHITQPPGDGNALGHLRFNFPNRFSVYQHDTPDKQLFGLDRRAFSHGCMRVQDPPKYAEVLLTWRGRTITTPPSASGTCTAPASRTSSSRPPFRSTSPTRPLSWMTPASSSSATTSTASTAA